MEGLKFEDKTFDSWSPQFCYIKNSQDLDLVQEVKDRHNAVKYVSLYVADKEEQPARDIILAILNLHKNSTYDPARRGAIDHIDFFLDLKSFYNSNENVNIVYNLLLFQDGHYFKSIDVKPKSEKKWTGFRVDNSKARHFVNIKSEGIPANPDFSNHGAPIQFGYYVVLSSKSVGRLMSETGLTNWKVSISKSNSGSFSSTASSRILSNISSTNDSISSSSPPTDSSSMISYDRILKETQNSIQKCKKLEKDMALLKSQNEDLQRLWEESTEEQNKLTNQNLELQAYKQDAESNKIEVNMVLDLLEHCKTKKAKYKDEMYKVQEKLLNLEEEYKFKLLEANVKIDTADFQLSDTRKELDSFVEMYRQAEVEIQKLQDKVAKLHETKSKLQVTVKERRAELEEVHFLKNKMDEELRDLTARMEDEMQTRTDLEALVQSKEEQLMELKQELTNQDKLRQYVSDLKLQLYDQSSAHDELEQLKKEMEKLKQENASLSDHITQQDSRIQTLQEELEVEAEAKIKAEAVLHQLDKIFADGDAESREWTIVNTQ